MDAYWLEPIRAYCERTDASFWSEPLNALSNVAFLVAAGAAARRAGRDPAALALAVLVAIVGIGSFLFHTFADRWSMLADVIPIAVFIYAYFGLAMRRFFRLPVLAAGAVTLAFAAFNLGFEPALDALTGRSMSVLTNGSIDYVPAVLALFGVGLGLIAAGSRRKGLSIVGIGGVFLASLTFRTLDAAMCRSLPSGTHVLWHLLNATVLYGLVAVAAAPHASRGRIVTRPPATSTSIPS